MLLLLFGNCKGAASRGLQILQECEWWPLLPSNFEPKKGKKKKRTPSNFLLNWTASFSFFFKIFASTLYTTTVYYYSSFSFYTNTSSPLFPQNERKWAWSSRWLQNWISCSNTPHYYLSTLHSTSSSTLGGSSISELIVYVCYQYHVVHT